MDRKRKLTKNELCRHGCAWCYDKECLEKEIYKNRQKIRRYKWKR